MLKNQQIINIKKSLIQSVGNTDRSVISETPVNQLYQSVYISNKKTESQKSVLVVSIKTVNP